YRGVLRYVKEWGWLVFDGRHWIFDRWDVDRMAKETARSILLEARACEDEPDARKLMKHAQQSANRSRLEAMKTACASEPGIGAVPSDFDSDPWLFNAANGTIDLRNGELREHRAADMITKLSAVEYDASACSKTWEQFMSEATLGDVD